MNGPDLDKRFLYQKAGPAAAWRHAAVSSLTLELARKLMKLTPASRQQALALTHLEETRMWANAAIACNQELLPGGEEPWPEGSES